MTIYDLGPYAGAALVFVLVAIGTGLFWLYERVTAKSRLRRAVWANLDSAYKNGYFEPGEPLHMESARGVTFDLRAYAPDMHEMPADKLLPHVQKWLAYKGL